MHKGNRRPISASNTEKILSELAILDPSSFSSTERESCEYIGSMALELCQIALLAREGYIGYLLGLVAKEARSSRVRRRRRLSPA